VDGVDAFRPREVTTGSPTEANHGCCERRLYGCCRVLASVCMTAGSVVLYCCLLAVLLILSYSYRMAASHDRVGLAGTVEG